MNLDKLKKKVIAETEKWRKVCVEKPNCSKKAQKLADEFEKVSWGDKETIRKMYSIIIEEKIPLPINKKDFMKKYVAIVPLEKRDSHSYKLHLPCIIRSGIREAIDSTLFKGNQLSLFEDYPNVARLATIKEIESLFASWEGMMNSSNEFDDILKEYFPDETSEEIKTPKDMRKLK